MPKKSLTESQHYRQEAARLVMENVKNERVLANPWITMDKMAMYLRYGDPNYVQQEKK